MTNFGKNFDPAAPLPRRHKRDLGMGDTGRANTPAQPPESSPPANQPAGQPGQAIPPRRWTRVSALEDEQRWRVLQRIGRSRLARAWRRRWRVVALAAVVLLVGLGVAAYWFGINPFTLLADKVRRNAGGPTSPADSGTSELRHSGLAPAEDGKSSNPSDGKASGPGVNRAPSSPVDLSELRKMVAPALVTITHNGGRGTGFVIDGGLVVTAYHVAPQGVQATVVYDSGEEAPVTGHVAYDELRDIAILRTSAEGHPMTLKLASTLPPKGARIASFKPGEGEIQGTMTEIEKHESLGTGATIEMLRSTLNAVPGWSGGPVVNMRGEVVGVNCRLDGSLFEAQGLRIATGSAAAPVTVVNRLLEIVSLSEKIRSQPSKPEYRRDRAALYMAKGEYANAIDDYTELVKITPGNAETYFRRGTAYAKDRNLKSAIADYTSAIQHKEHYVDAYRARAAAYEDTTDRDGAIGDYLELIRLLPEEEARPFEAKLVENYRGRAKAREVVGNYEKAIDDISKVLQRRRNDVEAYTVRARLYYRKGLSDKAIADYTEAIRLKPDSAELHRRRGAVHAEKGEHDKAIADYSDAIRLDPKDAEAYCGRGAVYGGRRDQEKAIADFTLAIELDPLLAKAYFDRGMAYKAQGKNAESERDFQRARELHFRPE